MLRLLVVTILAVTMVGCANQRGIYSWGDYEPLLYASYKDPTKVGEMRIQLEALISDSEQRKRKVPPGVYAELGTLYLQAGASDKAIVLYTKEREVWPESRGMMDALIKNLEHRQQQPTAGALVK